MISLGRNKRKTPSLSGAGRARGKRRGDAAKEIVAKDPPDERGIAFEC